jgi:hypothetical protein
LEGESPLEPERSPLRLDRVSPSSCNIDAEIFVEGESPLEPQTGNFDSSNARIFKKWRLPFASLRLSLRRVAYF